jgi:very-short-patch-repair endonuclease
LGLFSNPPLEKGRCGGVVKKIFNNTEQKIIRKQLRNSMPLPEVVVWSKLKRRQMRGYKFRRQYSIENFVVDFYCPELKLAIEIDGDSHYSLEAHKYDQNRQVIIESFGIEFLRFTNVEICNNLEGVTVRIEERIKQITSPTPP